MIVRAMNFPSPRTRADLVVFGEFFLDLVFFKLPRPPKMGEEVKTIHFAEFPGGGVATTSLVAAGLGTPTAVVARVGTDAQRHPAWQKLAHAGIHTGASEFSTKFPTAITVCAAYEGDRMMITADFINQKLHTLLKRPAVRQQCRHAKHVHLACALTHSQSWASAIRKLRSQSLTISADIGWNPEVLQSPRLPALLRQCDFAFPNELEAIAMTGEKSVEKAARRLAQWVRVPVVKLGRNGCIAVQDGKVLRVKSIRVRSADATGAGDAFNGGFLHGYLSGWSLENCLRAGNVCGAMATTLPGGASVILSQGKLLELMKRI
jgi:sugar/nucleoside kinase (ribokinase family)